MDWKAIIRKASNGFVVQTPREQFEGDLVKEISDEEVFEEKEGCLVKHTLEMLYSILEHFGEFGSKHDEHRIRIYCSNCDREDMHYDSLPYEVSIDGNK